MGLPADQKKFRPRRKNSPRGPFGTREESNRPRQREIVHFFLQVVPGS